MDAQNTLMNLLGDNAEEKIQAVLNALSDSSSSNGSNDSLKNESSSADNYQSSHLNGISNAPIDINMLEAFAKMKTILDTLERPADDARTHLLMSLRPYMREERQKGIDSALRVLSLTRLSDLLNNKENL